MFVRSWKKNSSYYASIVENRRIDGKVVQFTLFYFGKVSEKQIPYLKAAFAKEKPKLVYKDGRVYEG